MARKTTKYAVRLQFCRFMAERYDKRRVRYTEKHSDAIRRRERWENRSHDEFTKLYKKAQKRGN
jgi:hypothetical protein